MSSTARGTVTANTPTNAGTVRAVSTTAPVRVKRAERKVGRACCIIISMLSTSRTTLVCTIEALCRLWKPIDSRWRRSARALRTSTASDRIDRLDSRTKIMWNG